MKKTLIAATIMSLVSTPALASTVDEMKSLSDSVDVLRKNIDSHQNQINDNLTQVNKRNIMNTKNITELQIKKLNVTTYEAGQAKQDKALADETVARIEGDKRNEKALAGKVDNTTYQGDKAEIHNSINNVGSTLSDALTNEQEIRENQNTVITDRVDGIQSDVDKKVNNTIYQGDKTAINDRINDVGSTLSDALTNEQEIRENQNTVITDRVNVVESDLAGKVDNTTYQGDKAEIHNSINGTHQKIADETMTRIEADKNLSAQIKTKVDSEQYKEDKGVISNSIKTESSTRQQADVKLAEGIVEAKSTGEYAHARIDQANANIELNKQALVNTNKQVSQNTQDIARNDQRINDLEKTTNSNFSSLRNQVDKNKKMADAGTASVSAMANIPQVTEYGRFSLGAGIGTRGHERAVAIGASSRLSNNVIGKVSIASDTQSKFTFGAGVAVQW